MGDEERREREAVYDGWRLCETLGDVEEQEALVDRYAECIRAASGDPPDGHPHLAAPDGISPRVRLDPAGHLHEIHQGG